jgi:LemA protein
MMLILLLAIGFVVILILLYNRLVAARHRVLAAWSDIDVQLKRRHDLIPKLINAVRQYAQYEQGTLDDIVSLRERGQQTQAIAARSDIESRLGRRVQGLLALVENYPELRAVESFQQLQSQITEVENNIQYARRYYNGAVRLFNTRIESFPDLLLARFFDYQPADYFQLDAADDPDATGEK